MKQPAISTIVLVTFTRCVRGDDGGGVWSAARKTGQPLAESVRAALQLGGDAGRSVLVLTTDAWTQTVSLHRGQIADLSKSEVRQALAFEAEPFSGLSPLESLTGACECGARDGSASFWITQLARAEFDAVKRVVAERGGRLAGIGHPGGIPLPLTSVASGTAWRRVEGWDGAWLLVSCEDGRSVQTKVIPTAPDARDLPSHGTVERLNAQNSPPASAEKALSLSDEATLRDWLRNAATVFNQSDAALPLMVIEVPASTRDWPRFAGIALTAAVVLLTIGQIVWLRQREKTLLAEQESHAATAAQIDAAHRQIAKLKTELDSAKKNEATLRSVEQQRGALALMMKALTLHCPEDVVVRSIKVERGVMILGGVALNAASVDELGIVLTGELKPVRLVAQPVEKKARLNRSAWDFSLAVMPAELAAKALPAAQAVSEN